MKPLTILVDMDDTIENLLDAWLKSLNNKYGTSYIKEDIKNWNIASYFPMATENDVFAPLLSNDFWPTVTPKEDAQIVLRQLIEDGHSVYIVTASAYQTLSSKMENLLFKHFPFLTWNNVIITKAKQMIKGDILIDDGPHNLIDGDYRGILMDMPHNRLFDEKRYGITRVKSWFEIPHIIETVLKDRLLNRK